MSKSVFAVMEKNYEYNDEYYYQQGNGNLIAVFGNLEAATEYAEHHGAKTFRKNPEMYFGEEGYNFFYEQNGMEQIEAMSDEEITAFLEKNNIEVYEIQGIEVTDEFTKEMSK